MQQLYLSRTNILNRIHSVKMTPPKTMRKYTHCLHTCIAVEGSRQMAYKMSYLLTCGHRHADATPMMELYNPKIYTWKDNTSLHYDEKMRYDTTNSENEGRFIL